MQSMERYKGFSVDPLTQELKSVDGVSMSLRAQSMEVFKLLADNSNRLVSKAEILEVVWADSHVTEDSLVKCIADIRRSIGDSEKTTLVTVQRKGYRLIPDPKELKRTRFRAKNIAFALVSAIVLLVGIIFFNNSRSLDDTIPRIAVLEFASEDIENNTLGAGFAEDVISLLARNKDLQVLSRHSSFSLSGKKLSAEAISEALNARFLVDGKITHDGNVIAGSISVYDSSVDRIVESFQFESSAKDLHSHRKQLLDKLTIAIVGRKFNAEKTAVLQRDLKSLDPYLAALRTMARKHTFIRQEYKLARTDARRVLQDHPNYPPLLIALGWLEFVDAVNGISGDLSPAKLPEIFAMIRKGTELDPMLSAGWQASSLIQASMGDAEGSLRSAYRARELSPSDPDSHLYLAKAQTVNGEFSKADASIAQAQSGYSSLPGYFLLFRSRLKWASGSTAEAFQDSEECLAIAPRIGQCRVQKIIMLVEMGKTNEAIQQTKALVEFYPAVRAKEFAVDFSVLSDIAQHRISIGEKMLKAVSSLSQ